MLTDCYSALKLRYLLPVVMPSSDPNLKWGRALNGVAGAHHGTGSNTPSHGTPITSPTKHKFKMEELPIFFDGPLIARQGEGWDMLLETAIDRWVECVVAERRGEWRTAWEIATKIAIHRPVTCDPQILAQTS